MSKQDGEIHTVVTGRLHGIGLNDIKELAAHHIHVHLYSENAHDLRSGEFLRYITAAPDYFHIHSHIPIHQWTNVFSQYDASWLHCFDSKNEGNMFRVTWDDLNIPARIYTAMVSGIPTIQKNNEGHLVAMQELVKKFNMGIFYKNMDELSETLHNNNRLEELNKNVRQNRDLFCFDFHVQDLLNFFVDTISKRH